MVFECTFCFLDYDIKIEDILLSPSYNNSCCVYLYIFPVPRIVVTALNI